MSESAVKKDHHARTFQEAQTVDIKVREMSGNTIEGNPPEQKDYGLLSTHVILKDFDGSLRVHENNKDFIENNYQIMADFPPMKNDDGETIPLEEWKALPEEEKNRIVSLESNSTRTRHVYQGKVMEVWERLT